MTITQSPNNGILALGPPSAPEATSPVSGAHYGVPIHVYDLKPMGLKIDIFPPIVGKLAPGDIIRLIVNGASTSAIKTIAPGEENTVNTLYLPKGLLLQNRINTLIYTITRNSENAGTSTPELTLLYNSIRPGNQDLTPGDGAHSELQLILPQDVLDHGIDAERARQGVMVIFSYPFCRPHDHIWLNCNGSDVHYYVSIDEAPAIPSAEPTNISIMVGEDELQKAGDSPTFVFSYTVTDQLGNGPDANSPFSGAVTVDVHLKQTRLAAPDLAEDPTDPNDDPDTIDLGKLGKKDLSGLVHVFAPLWQINDKIHLIYTAAITGGPVVTHTVEENVSRVPFTYPLLVPNDKVIADSVVRVKYELVRDGSVIAISKIATAVVIGAGSIELLPPSLTNPAVNPINPLNGPVNARIEYLGAQDGDRARLVVVKPQGTLEFPLVEFNANKRVNTPLIAALLAAWHGQEIQLRWNLNRGGKQIGRSPVLTFRVLRIEDGDLRLPVPDILEAKGTDVVDLGSFEDHARFHLAPWSFIEQGQRITVTLTSENLSPLIILNNHPIDAEEVINGITKNISREWLDELTDGSRATLTTKLNLSPAIAFTTRSYTVKAKYSPPILSENFESLSNERIVAGQSMLAPAMKISLIRGSATSSAYIGGFSPDPRFGLRSLIISREQELEFNFKSNYSSLNFLLFGGRGDYVYFFDDNNHPLGNISIPPRDESNWHGRLHIFSGKNIRKMLFVKTTATYSAIDVFRFTV